MQQSARIKVRKINKIFLTHAHGDHSFGLPGMLCLMGQDRVRGGPPIDIYGPEGLRLWLRVAIRYSISRIVPEYRVHELMNVPMAPEWHFAPRTGRYYNGGRKDREWRDGHISYQDGTDSWSAICRDKVKLEASSAFGEVDGGRCARMC